MDQNITIPKKILVGFQKRDDTYTKKLAYVIYYDEKGKIRKEKSWESWRDKKIPSVDFENVPTDGFVLNKKVGGVAYSGWDARKTYVRIYDPRDFEFEISIPNLLYILENTNSIKGKGLEGEFVYGWSGTELLLIPTSAPDYVSLSKTNELLFSNHKITSKELILGATYRHKSNIDLIYMGRFERYEAGYRIVDAKNMGMHYFFIVVDDNLPKKLDIKTYKSLGNNLVSVVNSECIGSYADLFENMEHYTIFSPIDKSKDEFFPYDETEFISKFRGTNYRTFYTEYSGRTVDGRLLEYHMSNYYGHSDVRAYSYDGGRNLNFQDFKEAFEKMKPHYRKRYLANGKLHEDSK